MSTTCEFDQIKTLHWDCYYQPHYLSPINANRPRMRFFQACDVMCAFTCSFALTTDCLFRVRISVCTKFTTFLVYDWVEESKSHCDNVSFVFYYYFDHALIIFCLPGTRGQSLKEDWIAYICREILRVNICNRAYGIVA